MTKANAKETDIPTTLDHARAVESLRQSTEALRASDKRYRRLLETALEGIVIVNAQATITYVNHQMVRMLGYDSGNELVGQEVYRLLFPEDVTRARDRWAVRLQGVQGEIEIRLRRKDGTACFTIAHVSIENDVDSGAFFGTFTMFTDITERRRIQEELIAKKEEIVTIFERVNDAFSAFDHEWRFTYVNHEAERIFHKRSEELLGRCIWDEFPESCDTVLHSEYLRAVREQVTVAFEVYYERQLGWFEVRAYPSATGLSAYFRNITERKRGEEVREHAATEKARLVAELQEATVRQRRFLREMLSSLTEGRLHLCETLSELPAPLSEACDPVHLVPESLRVMRRQLEWVAEQMGLSREREMDLLTAVGGATMYAVVHAGGGNGQIRYDMVAGRVQIWVQDSGQGIAEDAIHRATLEKGYSSAGTLGHGFFLMLKTAEQIYLITGPQGTTVVLEQSLTPPSPSWFQTVSAAPA